MDWSKAKNILIIGLIFANVILLGYNSVNYYNTKDHSSSQEFIEEVVKILGKNGIKIEAHIPRNKMSLPSLLVEFESYTRSDLNDRFFNSKGISETPTNQFTKISDEDELISLLNSRRIIYEYTGEVKGTTKDFSEAKQIAKEFLLNHKFDIQNTKITSARVEDGVYYINFSKLYDGVVLERSYTNFVIQGDKVISMDRLWLNVIDKSDNSLNLTPSPKALLALSNNGEYQNRTITSIDECFYFDPEEQGYVEDITKASEGRAIPAWRIQFDDGENVVIESY